MIMLLNVANLVRQKGQRDLLEAVSLVFGNMDDACLYIIGKDKGMGPELLELANEKGIADNIRFPGRVKDVAPFYRLASLYVHPSHEEGCSNAILEAMWFGLLVVATAVGGVPEVVEHGVTGLLVPPKDPAALASAILDLLNLSANTKKAMGSRGAEKVRKFFTKAKMIEGYRGIYASAHLEVNK